MESTAARELRFAVAMNGGVSLAVWIGGVAHELQRFARKVGPWQDVVGDIDVVIDVFAGTSAGGINAAFLAVAQRYGVDLGQLRELWMDKAGLEPPRGDDAATARHLLREPKSGTQSLLDGEHFREQLEHAFLALLPADPSEADGPGRKRYRLDLRLTTTTFRGTGKKLKDQLDGQIGEREHRASFHFVDESPDLVGETKQDLTVSDAPGRERLARELARASRSTASFPFAFEPSVCAPDETAHLTPGDAVRDHLLDGGILNNLPVDQALEAIFAMPASHPVSRWLVTVVPDPSGTADDAAAAQDPGATPSVKEIVTASVVGIPRNQTIGQFVQDVEKRNGRVDGRRKARQKLLDISFPDLRDAAEALWPSYKASRPAQQELTTLATWPEYLSWETTVLDRAVALLLQLHAESGSNLAPVRDEIHMLRRRSDDGLPAVSAAAGRLLVAITCTWAAGEVPTLLTSLRDGDAAAQTTAREMLIALEVVQGAFELVEPGTEQRVSLGLLTPQRVAPLDDVHERTSADQKLAGDELGHFGAFLKRSWRANDWMWGRLDASTFLFDLLDDHRRTFPVRFGPAAPIPLDVRQRVQTAIVMDEAPRVCQAVLDDGDAGAQSKHGQELLRVAGITKGWGTDVEPTPEARWAKLRSALPPGAGLAAAAAAPPAATATTAAGAAAAAAPAGSPEPDGGAATAVHGVTPDDVAAAQGFLEACRIGEEHVIDELWTSLVARVGLRAGATTLTVARAAKLPLRSFLDKALVPVRAVALIANRYAQALRPRRAESHGPAWMARIATEVFAALALADLFGVELGVAGPFVWAAFSALLLGLLPFAPLTTLLTVVGVGLTGLAMSIHDRWLPDATPEWLVDRLPLTRWVGVPLILVTLVVITFPVVDRFDRFLRAILRRGHGTTAAIDQGVRGVSPT
jgi:predicted acylesterase/phospholipase RssA